MTFLDKVAGVIIDEDFVQIYDNVFEMRDMPVANTLDHNYFLHMWQTYAVSPFANAVAVIPNNLVAVQTAENTTIGNLPNNSNIIKILSGGANPAVGTNITYMFTADVNTVKGACRDLIWSLKSDDTNTAVLYPNGYLFFKTIDKTSNYFGTVKATAKVRGTNITKEFTARAGEYSA
jgi:hypothetical protein